MANPRQFRRLAFTLVELLVVIAIIGILLSLILIAAMQAGEEAKLAATQGLISKLDAALKDRMQAVMTQRIDVQNAHTLMAWPFFNGVGAPALPPPLGTNTASAYLLPQVLPRAQVIANSDTFRAEFPDVWFVQTTDPNYLINFGLPSYPNGNGAPWDWAQPIGTGFAGNSNVVGVYGATYGVAAGLYKNIGALVATGPLVAQTGADGADNDGDGMIDNLTEWGANAVAAKTMLGNHKHVTARSEMLYAILVESTGPYGSTMTRDDFAPTEVGDTDGDGLPEFIDAWGHPLQFFRWPVLYHSDLQKGLFAQMPLNTSTCPPGVQAGPFNGVLEPREQDPLDPNQTLMAPSWWSNSLNLGSGTQTGSAPLSGGQTIGALGFQNYFHLLIEPLTASQSASPCTYWDRGTSTYQRRAFFSRPLIMSAGPDGVYGVPILSDTQLSSIAVGGPDAVSLRLMIEGQAAEVDIVQRTTGTIDQVWNGPYANGINPDTGNAYIEDGSDDITNQSAGSLQRQTP